MKIYWKLNIQFFRKFSNFGIFYLYIYAMSRIRWNSKQPGSIIPLRVIKLWIFQNFLKLIFRFFRKFLNFGKFFKHISTQWAEFGEIESNTGALFLFSLLSFEYLKNYWKINFHFYRQFLNFGNFWKNISSQWAEFREIESNQGALFLFELLGFENFKIFWKLIFDFFVTFWILEIFL